MLTIIPHDRTAKSRTRKGQLGNLLGNTLQYPSNGILVKVKILKWDDFVVMELADTGVGVACNQPMIGKALLRITVLSDF